VSKWLLIIDVALCHDCNNCFLACKDEFCENDFLPYSLAQPRHGHRWIDILRKERGQYPLIDVAYLPVPCMHCDEAPCLGGSGDAIVYKREDGIVLIDPKKAKGQRELLDACPYGAIWWNEETETPQKCTFCVHLLDDGWQQPRCVQACPTGAMRFLNVIEAEQQRLIESEKLEAYQPQYGTVPRVYYKNLYRFTHCFIAGSVAFKEPDECAEGAKVTLKDDSGRVIADAGTNNYGDFRVDGLEEGSGSYRLVIELPGYPRQEIQVVLGESQNIGTVFL
jgi:Fe-S-cluster-containing dehydrogenase component